MAKALLAKRLFSIANWSTLRKQPHRGIPQMRTMTVSKCRNLRWLVHRAWLFGVRVDAWGVRVVLLGLSVFWLGYFVMAGGGGGGGRSNAILVAIEKTGSVS